MTSYRLGLIGHPIAQSLSPVMHKAALAEAGLGGDYVRLEASDLERFRAHIGGLGTAIDGVNVTLPWKLEAARVCERLEGAALRLGAVNTVVVETRGGVPILVGHNTDVPGLVAALRERWPSLQLGDASALVIGAGGAAYAALLAAHELGARDILVFNRTAARAVEMVESVGLGRVVTDLDELETLRPVGLVLQAGSHGMGLSGKAFDDAVDAAADVLRRVARDAKVMDLVYRPRPTAWVEAARRCQLEAEDGLAMLIHQGALAFSLWTGLLPPVAVMRAAAEAELLARAEAG
jgi:shikimate dehydrogenase